VAYRYVEGITLADVAMEASGESISELFASAWDAVLDAMDVDPALIRPIHRRPLEMHEERLDVLLHGYLESLLYFRDAEELLLRPEWVKVDAESVTLRAALAGERIRRSLGTEVKAVTWHHFRLSLGARRCKAVFVLDV
jgi:SHS2 domain-containing protein